MSKHDFFMIATGAVLGLVITGGGKWLFGIFDAVVPVSKAPEKVRVALSKKANRSLFWTSLLLLFEIGSIISFGLDKSPVTRLSILYGALLLVCSSFIFAVVMWELQSVLSERRKAKAAESATTSH
jgi:hypothetical protein